MKKKVKYIIIFILFLLLIIPLFFNVFLNFFWISDFNQFVFLILLLGFLLLFIIGKLIEIYAYNAEIIRMIKKHDVINSFLENNNKIIRWLGFLIIIIIEELIFRYYLIGLLINRSQLNQIFAILISSLVFSIYHIHIWFSYKNLRILIIYLSYSFFLGLYNGYFLLTLGIIPCILLHYVLAYLLYYSIYKRYFHYNNKRE